MGAKHIRSLLKISGLYAAGVLPSPLINTYPVIINIEPIDRIIYFTQCISHTSDSFIVFKFIFPDFSF